MTRTIDIPTFQAAVVRNCSPTLAGIKPASLFTYPGTYAHGDGSTATETIAERRARLLNVIAQCNRELDPLAEDCALFIDAAAHGGRFSGHDGFRDIQERLLQGVVKCALSHLAERAIF